MAAKTLHLLIGAHLVCCYVHWGQESLRSHLKSHQMASEDRLALLKLAPYLSSFL